jgi:hypothetical protein
VAREAGREFRYRGGGGFSAADRSESQRTSLVIPYPSRDQPDLSAGEQGEIQGAAEDTQVALHVCTSTAVHAYSILAWRAAVQQYLATVMNELDCGSRRDTANL